MNLHDFCTDLARTDILPSKSTKNMYGVCTTLEWSCKVCAEILCTALTRSSILRAYLFKIGTTFARLLHNFARTEGIILPSKGTKNMHKVCTTFAPRATFRVSPVSWKKVSATEFRTYCKIQNISPGLIKICKHFLGDYSRGEGLYLEGIFC